MDNILNNKQIFNILLFMDLVGVIFNSVTIAY